jgi:hypothetical protein
MVSSPRFFGAPKGATPAWRRARGAVSRGHREERSRSTLPFIAPIVRLAEWPAITALTRDILGI